MAVTGYEGRNVLIANIDQQLGAFVSSAAIAIKKNLPSYNVVAETTLAGLLNLIHGWNLVNANSKKQNFPGVDLIDTDARVAVQVTSTNKPDKVDHTLEQFADKNYGTLFDKLIILVITDDNPTPAMRSRTLSPWFSGETDIWNMTKVSEQIQNLQDIALVDQISDYLIREVGSFTDYVSRQHLYLPPVSAVGDGFVGRRTELTKIGEKLRGKVKPIVLSGLGGMGKTELAVRFGQRYEDGNVYFVRFNATFTDTVTSMFSGIYPRPEDGQAAPPEAEQYKAVMSLLEKCSETDILIIDNVDADQSSLRDLMKDAAYTALKNMKLRLILTTRFDEDRAVDVIPMPEENLFEIFEKHGAALEESQMRELIKAVNGHTLTIDLMARTLNGKGWRKVTPEIMLTAIRENTLPSKKYRKIASDYSQSPEQAQIYQHLSVVFNVADVPEDGKNVLRCATLLPADGMNGEYFGNALPEEQQEALDTLIDHGWLNDEDGLLTIHPVIRLVCREELKPSDANCGDFLEALWDQVDFKKHERIKFSQLAELYAQAADTLEDGKAKWLNSCGRLWNELVLPQQVQMLYERHLTTLEQRLCNHTSLATAYNNISTAFGNLGEHSKALEYTLKAVAICERLVPPDHPDLAAAYNNVGFAYNDIGKHSEAMEFLLKAMKIHEKSGTTDRLALAISYNNVGFTFSAMGDYAQALEYELKALAIRKEVLPPDHPVLATSYDNVGFTFGDLGEHAKALDNELNALAIREKVLPSDHPDLAISYNNVGTTYGQLGNHRKALEYQSRALAIWEKVLPPDHPSLAISYSNLGITHNGLGEYHAALECQLKALLICEKIYPPNHPGLANTYSNISLTYDRLNDHDKALEYQFKAIHIREKIFPPDHPSLALSYNNIGYIYGQLCDHHKALEYQRKALVIQESVLPPDHPNLAACYNNVGTTYDDLGDHLKALECKQKALDIYERVLPSDHPDLATSCNSIATTYLYLGNYSKALFLYRKALSIREKKLPAEHPYIEETRQNIAFLEQQMKKPEKPSKLRTFLAQIFK